MLTRAHRGRPGNAPPFSAGQAECAVHEGGMAERLREFSQEATRMRLDLLREEPRMVGAISHRPSGAARNGMKSVMRSEPRSPCSTVSSTLVLDVRLPPRGRFPHAERESSLRAGGLHPMEGVDSRTGGPCWLHGPDRAAGSAFLRSGYARTARLREQSPGRGGSHGGHGGGLQGLPTGHLRRLEAVTLSRLRSFAPVRYWGGFRATGIERAARIPLPASSPDRMVLTPCVSCIRLFSLQREVLRNARERSMTRLTLL